MLEVISIDLLDFFFVGGLWPGYFVCITCQMEGRVQGTDKEENKRLLRSWTREPYETENKGDNGKG